jgi:endonuclease/exonuclease/phosphatase family metal-dependent hydrolase
MGLVLPRPARDVAGARSLKLMSFNISSAALGEAAVLTAIDGMQADVVLLQEVSPRHDALLRGLRARFAHVDASTQFVIASRFPITEQVDPGRVHVRDRARSPRFVRYVLDSPLGPLAVYSVHPISPRGSLGVHRFRDLFHVARTGGLLQNDAENSLRENATLREQQVAAVAAMAKREKLPVLLAGDTNLPGSSAALHRHLSSYRDAFRTASWGFGYTYPQRHAFLRLDRILGSQELDFSAFEIGCAGASDHFCVASRVILR